MTQLNRSYANQTKLMEQSDGAKIHRPSDAPIDYSKYLRYSTSYGENDQYQYNIKTAVSWMKNTDAALVDMSDAMKTVVEKANQAQGTNTATDMAAIASEMLVMVQQCVSDANMQVNGRYLFAGQADLIQPYTLSNDKYERGLTKTLDDKQTAFFSGSSTVAPNGSNVPAPATSGDLCQMLTMTDDDGNLYYLNTLSGDIYTKDFVDEGYKTIMNDPEAMKDPNYLNNKAAGRATKFESNTVSNYFNEYGVIKQPEGTEFKVELDNGVMVQFATVNQYIVTYQGDKKQFSMVKENGAAQPATDTVNAGGVDIAGSSIFDNEEAYPFGHYPGASGANAFNDLLTVVAMCERDDSRWMSSDGKTLANNSFNTVNIAQTVVAARQQVYTDCEEMLTTQSETILEDITTVHSTDVAKLAVEMMTAQTIYNLSLSVGSRVIPPTLADYL